MLQDIGLGKDVLDLTPKGTDNKSKDWQMGCIQLKSKGNKP
jgi:hypothetical protein